MSLIYCAWYFATVDIYIWCWQIFSIKDIIKYLKIVQFAFPKIKELPYCEVPLYRRFNMYDTSSIVRMHPIDTFVRNDPDLWWDVYKLAVDKDIKVSMYVKQKLLD